MKLKLFVVCLLLSSLIGYLEWGNGNNSFLISAEMDVFNKLISDPNSVIHPLIIAPLIGQILLLATLFQKEPKKLFLYSGIICIGILFTMISVVGILSFNIKIILSTLPFIGITAGLIMLIKKQKQQSKK